MFVKLHCTLLQLRDLRSVLCSLNIEIHPGGFQSTLVRFPIWVGKVFKITAFRESHARNMTNTYRHFCLYIMYAFVVRMMLPASQFTYCLMLRWLVANGELETVRKETVLA